MRWSVPEPNDDFDYMKYIMVRVLLSHFFLSDFLSITKCLPMHGASNSGGKRFPCELFFQSILDFMAIDQNECWRNRGREPKQNENIKNEKKNFVRASEKDMFIGGIPLWWQQYNVDTAPKEWITTSRSQTNPLSPFKIACSWTFLFLSGSLCL